MADASTTPATAPPATAPPAAAPPATEPPKAPPGEPNTEPSAEPSGDQPAVQPRNLPGHIKTKVIAGADKITDKTERIRDKTNPPGGYDDTPPPRATGPAYTLKFTFHRASNLPAADISNSSSDPFIRAILTVPGLETRNADDPDMVHRTHTVHSTTEPEWEESWVVAGVPASGGGFRLKCRLYDEDTADHDDRLGNVTVEVPSLEGGQWKGLDHVTFDVKKRMGSKRAYLFKAASSALMGKKLTPTLELSIAIVGESPPSSSQRLYTVGPTGFVRHFSPMIGRITNTLVNKDEAADEHSNVEGTKVHESESKVDKDTKKYDFQANEIQLQGPVPEKLYHRYVEFRPIIGRMFSSHGLRGRILNKALHKQHNRVYNFSGATEYGTFPPCSDEASLQFLKLAHFDEGGRIFTYMISLDGVFRFTETGKEFGIDLLSKHTMHSDVARYIAMSGEFFIRRLAKPSGTSEARPAQPTHPAEPLPGGPPVDAPPHQPGYYQLIIDNDSGTYRPDKSLLPLLQEFLERNFPGLGVVTMHWEDETLQEMKKAQHESKKAEGGGNNVQMVLNRSPSSSSFSSSDESRLSDMGHGDGGHEGAEGHMEGGGNHGRHKSKKERAWDLLEDPSRIKDLHSAMHHHSINDNKAE